MAELIASIDIIATSRTNRMARNSQLKPGSLQVCQQLPYIEAQFGIESQRAVMICSLHQAHAGESFLSCALQHIFHQVSPEGAVLHLRGDRQRTNTRYDCVFPQEIAAHDLSLALGNY